MRKEFYIKTVDIEKIKNELSNRYVRKMPDDIDITSDLDNLIWGKYRDMNILLLELVDENVIEINALIDLIILFHIIYTELKNIMDEERFYEYMIELDIRLGIYFDLAYEYEMYETMENFKKLNNLYLNVDNFSIEGLKGKINK